MQERELGNTKLPRESAMRGFACARGGSSPMERQGDVIGPYRLCELLGDGGFGNVWRAEQTQPVRRDVAVKVIKLGMDSVEVLRRFDHERQALASMDHPCIALMIEAGISPAGRSYFAMELVKGDPINLWCKDHASPMEERLRIFQQVCLAVQHAHQKGIIHRDLKPSNILVTRVDSQPMPKVIDFGIAKAVHADAMDRTLLTRAEDVLGTPCYMSPEQIERRPVIDTRSDVYSLGVLLYELLTGVLPFGATGGAEELKRLKRETSPPRPSTQIRSHKPRQRSATARAVARSMPFEQVPPDLDWITMRALEVDAKDRYQTAAELAADVQRFLDREPVLARPPRVAYVAGRWIRRHRAIFAAACLAVLAMMSGTAIALWQAQRARTAQHVAETKAELARLAERQARQAEAQAESAGREARQTAAFLTTLLDRVGREVSDGRNPEALKAALSGAGEDILELDAGPELRIELLDKLQAIYSMIGEPKLAIPLTASKAKEVATLHGRSSSEAFNAELAHAKMVLDFGARASSPELIEDLRRRVEASGGRGEKFWMDVQRTLIRAWIKLEIPQMAIEEAEELMAEATRQKPAQRGLMVNLTVYASALECAGRYDEAKSLLLEARNRTVDEYYIARIDEHVIKLLEHQGDFEGAADHARFKLAELQERHGEHATELIPVLRQLGRFEGGSGNHDAAIAHCEQALAIARNAAARSESATRAQLKDIWLTLRDLADRESEGARHESAIAHGEEALFVANQMENNQLITSTLRSLSDVHRSAGDLERAYEIKLQSYERIRNDGANLRDSEQELREMCRIRLEQGRPEEAMGLGVQLWQDIQSRPESKQDLAHLGAVARTILDCHAVFQASRPDAPQPEYLAEWRLAVEAGETVRKNPE